MFEMKYLLVLSLFLIGCTQEEKEQDYVYIVQAPGIIAGMISSDRTYICKRSYEETYENCLDSKTGRKVKYVYSNNAIRIDKKELK